MSGRSVEKSISSVLATRHQEEEFQLSHILSVPTICSQFQTVCKDVDQKMHYAVLSSEDKVEFQRNKRHKLRSDLGRSRSGVWGPTHSSDSDSDTECVLSDENSNKEMKNLDHQSVSGSGRNQTPRYQCGKNLNESGTPNTSTTREESLSVSNWGNNLSPQETSTDPISSPQTESPANCGGWSPAIENIWGSTVDIFQQWSRKPCMPCGADTNQYTYLKDDISNANKANKFNTRNNSKNESNDQKTCGNEYDCYTNQRNKDTLKKDPKVSENQCRFGRYNVVTPTTSQSSSELDDNLKTSTAFSRKNISRNNLLDNGLEYRPKNQSASNQNDQEHRYDDEGALAAAKAAAAQIIYQQQTVKQRKSHDSPQKNTTFPSTPRNLESKKKIVSSPPSTKEEKKQPPPIKTLEITPKMLEFERSVSELTMRSCNGGHFQARQLSETRRMAYYAVGKQLPNKSPSSKNQRPGGNRTCYFTGNIILGGTKPFYAGCVQQGLRTLVVFCAPAALGYPTREALKAEGVDVSSETINNSDTTTSLTKEFAAMEHSDIKTTREDNLNIPLDTLINALPLPSRDLLQIMKSRYSEQYNTLPVQLRSEKCWKIYVKFCFFSGLPIAESDVHYRVQSDILKEFQDQEEEISLSHEVMVIVNGEQSADILRLPNKKTFRYLKKHYQHQSTKLPSKIFDRLSWEMVMPEV